MNGYTKLFSSILDSTIWQEDLPTKVLWVTMLAMSDFEGVVEGSIPGLARRAGISIAECEKSLSKLYAPDKYSRTPDYEGRRVEAIDGGWLILNRAKYRDKGWEDDRVKRHREANRRYYSRLKASDNSDPNSDSYYPNVSESDGVGDKKEKEKEKEESKSKSLSLRSSKASRLPEDFVPSEEHYALGKELGINTDMEFQKFRDYFLGVSGSRGIKLDWAATLRNWLRNSLNYQRGGNGTQKSAAQLRSERNKALIERSLREDESPAYMRPGGGQGTSGR